MDIIIIAKLQQKKNSQNERNVDRHPDGQLEDEAGPDSRRTKSNHRENMEEETEESSVRANNIKAKKGRDIEHENESSNSEQELALRLEQEAAVRFDQTPGAYSMPGAERGSYSVENAPAVDSANIASAQEDSIFVPEALLVTEPSTVIIGKEVRWYQKGRNTLILALLVVFFCLASVAIVVPVVTKDKSSPANAPDKETEALPTRWKHVGGGIIYGLAPYDRLGTSSKISTDGKIVATGSGFHTVYTRGTQNARPGYVNIFSLTQDDAGLTQLVPHGTIEGKEDNDIFGWSLDLSASGDRIAVGVPGGGSAQRGLVRVYQNLNGSLWSPLGTDIVAPDVGLNISLTDAFYRTAFPSTFGYTLAISADGKTVAIGDPNYPFSGAVYVYRYDETKQDWLELGNLIVGSAEGDFFGWTVSLSANGKRLAVGAPGFGPLQGQVQVFDLQLDNSWKQTGSNLNGLREADEFGNSVSLSGTGDLLAVASNRHDGGQLNEIVESGMVQVFQFDGIDWEVMGQNLYGKSDGDRVGWSLSLAKDVPVVAAGGVQLTRNRTGTVRVFEWNGTEWQADDSDLFGETAADNFGNSLCLSSDGKHLVVGAWKNDGKGLRDAGQINVYASA